MSLEDRIELRDYANERFAKTFNFYQLKEPGTYFTLISLGRELTKADEHQLWQEIRHNQEKILQEKRIKHRNFGDYSRHNCGYDTCPMNGIMVRQGSWLAEGHMWFNSDKGSYSTKERSKQRKKTVNQPAKLSTIN